MDVERLFAVGLAVGFAFDVRPQNAPFILVPLIVAWGTGNRAWPDREACLSYIAGVAVAALPQLVVGQILWGTPLAFVNIGAKGNDWQSFTHVRLWEVLFDSYHGLAVWTPLLLLALIGFALLYKDDRRLGIAAISMFAIQWLMIGTLDRAWWGGAAFGQRRFDNCTIFFILGLAALFSRLSAPLSIAITALTSLWTLALFFATFDLNAYQSFDELARGALHAQWRLSFVPPAARVAVWLMMLTTALLLVAIAAILRRVNATAVVAAYFLAFAALFAWCGSHDAAHMLPWRAVIATNRAHPTAIPVTNVSVVRHDGVP
jgi:hypothetical protein